MSLPYYNEVRSHFSMKVNFVKGKIIRPNHNIYILNKLKFIIMAKKSEMDEEITYLELERSRINREKGKLVLNMGLVLYFGFLVAGVIGFAFEYIDSFLLNVLVICGIVILIVSTVPYLIIVYREEKWIKLKLYQLRK